MDNYKLVQPGHLNHYGFLFGGNLLKWVDECAYMAACAAFPGERFVTVALENLVFKKSVRSGDILLIRSTLAHCGVTSVRYDVAVYRTNSQSPTTSDALGEPIFSSNIAYVCIDASGQKKPLP